MAVYWSEESFYKKEMDKWNRPKREGGYNRDGFEKFPLMLYKAQLNPLSGKHEVALSRDVISADKTIVILSAEAFNNSCQMVVNDERELERAKADGWRETQREAMAYHESLQNDIAKAAAERAYDDRNMSAGAKAESKQAEEATAEHLAEVKEKRRANMAKARAAKVKKAEAPVG